MHSTPDTTSLTTIVIVGAGRLGGVLARALSAAGFDVRGPIRRGEQIPDADIVLLCVPDAAIAEVAASARPHAAQLGHVSGATPLPDVDFSIHPLQTFTGSEPPEVFHGIGAAIDGRTPGDLATAERLARALGANPFVVDDAHRATYHAAASFASNFVLTVLDAAEQLSASAGVERAHLAPLVRQTVDNWVESGGAAALTGPIARGDDVTVERQRAASAEFGTLFDALATATRSVAGRASHATHASRATTDTAADHAATSEEPRA